MRKEPWPHRVPPEEVLAALERLSGPAMRAVAAGEVAAALGVKRKTALRQLDGLRRMGLASARDRRGRNSGKTGPARWVPRRPPA